jgi:starch synthase
MKTVINYMRPQAGNAAAGEILGIEVAVTQFLKAFFRYSRQPFFFFLPGSDSSIDELKQIAHAELIDFTRCAWIPALSPEKNMADVDLLFRPDPNIADHVWRRLQLGKTSYGACSIIHTLSGERVAGVLSDYLTAPTQSGDAIICPSNAIRDAILALWQVQGEYYQHRFRAHVTCPVELPVIPLGINTGHFADQTTPEKRAAVRGALGIAEDEVVILHVGRMSYATKAHPLPLLRAAEIAAQQLPHKKVRLLMYGFFKPESMEPEFRSLAADICRHVQVDFIANTDARFPDGVWAAGDLFASLIDNIQESFGFTPIEAMACGLPAVVSDWDGYRDSVRHGMDGFLVPTMSLPEGQNRELAAHYFNSRNYGDYLIRNNQSVAVDIDVAAAAFRLLIEDEHLRKNMGAQGRARAAEKYDWRSIIPAYEDLWEELAAKHKSNHSFPAPRGWHAVHPSYPDPSTVFKSFATTVLAPDDKLEIVGKVQDIELIARHRMNIFGMDMLLAEEIMSTIMETLYARPQMTVVLLQQTLNLTDTPRFLRTIGWFLKMGLMRVTRG